MTCDLDARLDLAGQLLELLREAPEGLSEYQLIQQLKARHSTHVPHLPLLDKLVLFRTHFLVFNALYRLRDELCAEEAGFLQIGPLQIRLLPWQSGAPGLVESDPLRAYYLDESNLRDTTERDVEKLLESFWTRMQGDGEKAAALALFELEDGPVDYALIKLRYRQLVSQHHPDRGGSTTRLQSINKAMEILERYYSRP
ncbi:MULTISPECIES: DNA-J related domain-containing protein [Pseudomonas]|uniref:DNA-J related domain-containing protein n=1 Tax=Pseudomonas TaxID=286 RepID=UPI000D6F3C3D|nr:MULTISPECIES: DNA-J related domain-containing protein [unclassified Pseudomonas]MED5607356.1 DNA-J related domain-containing protein [Pseudomonas sp. JH-2]PWU27468.1 molecular chaperone DnaJ [Pseudomonas sp. RW407]